MVWEHEGNRAVRMGQWKLVGDYPGDWELYNTGADRQAGEGGVRESGRSRQPPKFRPLKSVQTDYSLRQTDSIASSATVRKAL